MFEDAEQIIVERLTDLWVDTPIDFDNVRYKPTKGVPFVRLQIEWTNSTPVSIASPKVKVNAEGYTQVSVFVPFNTGTRYANELADKIGNVYDRFQEDELTFMVSRVVRVGETDGWYQINVLTPFKYVICK